MKDQKKTNFYSYLEESWVQNKYNEFKSSAHERAMRKIGKRMTKLSKLKRKSISNDRKPDTQRFNLIDINMTVNEIQHAVDKLRRSTKDTEILNDLSSVEKELAEFKQYSVDRMNYLMINHLL